MRTRIAIACLLVVMACAEGPRRAPEEAAEPAGQPATTGPSTPTPEPQPASPEARKARDLVAKLGSEDDEERTAAAGRITALGAQGIPALAEALRGADRRLCPIAASAMAAMGPEAVASIAALLGDAGTEARLAAVLALDELGEAARPALGALHRASQDANPRVRYLAQLLVGRLSRSR